MIIEVGIYPLQQVYHFTILLIILFFNINFFIIDNIALKLSVLNIIL